MRADDFRRIALGMKGAVEGAHMGHPDFRSTIESSRRCTPTGRSAW